MLALARCTIRAHRVSFAGALVAVSIGVALVCASGLLMAGALTTSGAGRFAAADAVVEANSRFLIGHGNDVSAVTVHPSARLPSGLVREVGSVPGVGRAVGDLAFPATALDPRGRALSARGADRTEAHGWASARFTPYALEAGRPPERAAEVALDARLAAGGRVRVGQALRVIVPAGVREFRISGIVRARGGGDPGQSALFFTDTAAAGLALSPGEVNAVGVFAAAGVHAGTLRARLRERLGNGVTVLDRAHAAEADAGDPRASQREDTIAVLGTLAALAGVIAVFVVASTFALQVVQRRQELALLRTLGATPWQVRRMIAGEALVVALLGGMLGCLAGLPLAAAIGRGLVDHGIAPQSLRASVNTLALLIALAAGVLIAGVAVLPAAHRAARISPAEALREAQLEPRRLGLTRWLLGLAVLAAASAMLALFSGDGALTFAEVTAGLLAIGLALLSPLVLALPAIAVSLPLRAGAPGLLASAAIATHRRRSGAIAAPIVLLVALTGTYAITETTRQAATQTTTAQRVRAPFAVLARSGPGLPLSTQRLVARLPGVTAVAATLPATIFLLDSGLENFDSPWQAAGLAPPQSTTLELGIRSGSLNSLHGGTIAISTTLAAKRRVRVGAVLEARLSDGTPARLRVGAIFDRSLGLGDVLLPMPLAAAHAAVKLANTIFIAAPATAAGRLRDLTAGIPTAAVLTRRQYLDSVRAAAQTSAWIVWLLIALIGAFAGLSVLNTGVMASAERRHEIALVRLIGATRRQARRMIAWEALSTSVVGVVVGALAARVAVSRIPNGRPAWHVVVPPLLFAAILASAAALGLVGQLLPGGIALRPGSVAGGERRE